jgi:hypothetical protein
MEKARASGPFEFHGVGIGGRGGRLIRNQVWISSAGVVTFYSGHFRPEKSPIRSKKRRISLFIYTISDTWLGPTLEHSSRAMVRNWRNSLLVPLAAPSATLLGMETDARLI